MADTSYADMDRLTPKQKAKKIEENKKKEELKSFMYRNAKSGSIFNVEKVLEDAGQTLLNKKVSKPFKTLKIQAEERAKEQYALFPIVNASLLNEKINEMIVNINGCCETRMDGILLMDSSYDDVVSENLRILISENDAISRQKGIDKSVTETDKKDRQNMMAHTDLSLHDGLVVAHKEQGVVEGKLDTIDVNKFIWELLIEDNNNSFYAGVVDLINFSSSSNKGLSGYIHTISQLVALINYPVDQPAGLLPPHLKFTHINTLQLLFGYILKKDGILVNLFIHSANNKYVNFNKVYKEGFLKLLRTLQKTYLKKKTYDNFLAALKSEEFTKPVSDDKIEVFTIISKGQKKIRKKNKKKMTKKNKPKKHKKKKKTKMR